MKTDWKEDLLKKMMESGCEGYPEFVLDYVETLLKDNDSQWLKRIEGAQKEVEKLVIGEHNFINAPSASDDEVDMGSARIDAWGEVLEILNKIKEL